MRGALDFEAMQELRRRGTRFCRTRWHSFRSLIGMAMEDWFGASRQVCSVLMTGVCEISEPLASAAQLWHVFWQHAAALCFLSNSSLGVWALMATFLLRVIGALEPGHQGRRLAFGP